MAFVWYIFNRISVENDLTSQNEEFVRCKYPKSINIRYSIFK